MHEVAGPERRADAQPGLNPQSRLQRYEQAFAELDAPFAFVDLDAMWSNADQLLLRAGDKPIRVAAKSPRCRPLQREIRDANQRFDGLMTFTLPRRCAWISTPATGAPGDE